MKKIIIAALVLCIGIAAAFSFFRPMQYTLVITQQQINEALQKKFPITKKHLKIFHITYSNPRLTLPPDSNRLDVVLDAEVELSALGASKKFGGTVHASSAIDYRNETKQFFLSKPEISKVEIPEVPEQFLDKVVSFASNAAREHLEQVPVYTLTAKDTKMAAVKMLLKDLKVKNGEVHVTLGL